MHIFVFIDQNEFSILDAVLCIFRVILCVLHAMVRIKLNHISDMKEMSMQSSQ